jgi:transcriptional regulator with XRE-family HTH domain
VGTHQVKIRYAKKLKAFGAHLKKIREKRGWSQEEMAHRAGISYNSLNTLENGKLNPTLATLHAIADSLEMKLRDLVDY